MFVCGFFELMSINRGVILVGVNSSDFYFILCMKLGNYLYCIMVKVFFGLLFICFYLEVMIVLFKGEGNYGFMFV